MKECEKDDALILCKTIAEAVTMADEGRADCAFVPVENSLVGSVTATMDSLVKAEDLHIIAEHKVKIHHCLMAPLVMENVSDAIDVMKKKSVYFRVSGSYPGE